MSSHQPARQPARDVERAEETDRTFDVAVLGGGSAATTLVEEVGAAGCRVVVFEPGRVGGECPYVACMPAKSMLADAAARHSWSDAIRRRSDVVEHLDDSQHALDLQRHGAVLVRASARLAGDGTVEADGRRYRARHVVLATGSEPVVPPIAGLDDLGDRYWTSADALVVEERPTRLTIVGGGVIGCELATIFAGFGTEVHLFDSEPHAFPDLPGEIGVMLDDALGDAGVRVRRGVTIERVDRRGGAVRTTLDNGATVDTDRILVATGTRPRIGDLGLETVGIDIDEGLVVELDGRVAGRQWLWAIGDVAGHGEYTHLANHQARVVADALVGDGTRRFDDVVLPACVFTAPPIVTIGARPADTTPAESLWIDARLGEIPRATTDELGDGFLTIAVDRSTHAVVGAHGIGARFDELAAALVTAIDGRIPVERLARSMWPFPTVGEILGLVYSRAASSLDES
jgi:pyruvate/2-oxoglutarate dehydrogenase complex dihydrolipoamide dehydrogenase (E3) component